MSIRAFRAMGLGCWIRLAVAIGAVVSQPAIVQAQGRAMIEHIEPTAGPPGTRVQIVGRNFRSSLRVLFNEREVPIVERLPERITVEIPAGAETGRFVVAHGSDEVESEVFRITVAPPGPRVTTIEPTSAAPGSEVLIRGENFGARLSDNSVRIGTTSMVVRQSDATSLRVIVPEGAVSGPMTVRTPGGETTTPSLTVAARVVIREFRPTATAPGGRVVLTGSGFSANSSSMRVLLGTRPVRVLRSTATEMEVEVPTDATEGGNFVVEVTGAGRFETGSSLRVSPAPIITAVNPPHAPVGARITLRGQRFGTEASRIRLLLGTTPASVISVGPSELQTTVPAGAQTGRWSLTVDGIGPVQSAQDFNVLAPVTLANFAPRAGDVGDTVTLTGTGFSPAPEQNLVRLGGIQARVLRATTTELSVEIPSGARSGPFTVAVTGSGEGRAREPFMITVRPRITALEPDRGVAGDRVTLRGSNFPTDRGLLTVRLNDIECPIESTAADAIVVTVPRGLQPGAARFVVVVRLQGTGRATNEFFVLVPTRIASITPAAAAPGARVTVLGEGFETDRSRLRVVLGTTPIQPIAALTTSIEFLVPRNAASGDLRIEAEGRQPAVHRFVVQAAPIVRSFAPAQGPAGTAVTLRGSNLGTSTTDTRVLLNGLECTVRSAEASQVVVEVPPGARPGRFTVQVRDQGEAQSQGNFRVTGR